MSSLFGKLCGSDSSTAHKDQHKDAVAHGSAPMTHPTTHMPMSGAGASTFGGGSTTAWNCDKGCKNQTDCSHFTTGFANSTTGGWYCDKGCKAQTDCSHVTMTREVDSRVSTAPVIQLPTQYLPTIHKTEVLPTEVHREVHTVIHNVEQPMRRDIVQPIQTTVERPVVKEIQPVHQTVIQPKVETVLHEAPAKRIENVHQTKTLGTVAEKFEKPPVELAPKVGAPIPAPPVVEKTKWDGTGDRLAHEKLSAQTTTFDKTSTTGTGMMHTEKTGTGMMHTVKTGIMDKIFHSDKTAAVDKAPLHAEKDKNFLHSDKPGQSALGTSATGFKSK